MQGFQIHFEIGHQIFKWQCEMHRFNISLCNPQLRRVKNGHNKSYNNPQINQIGMQAGHHPHGHGHGQQGGHTHHAGCSHGSQQHQVEPEQYFKQLKQLKAKNKEFYWNEVLKGVVLSKYLQHYGMGFLNSINAQILQGVAGMAHMMLTCDWMPLIARPFISGIFWPFLLYVFMNYKIITGISTQQSSASQTDSVDRSVLTQLFWLPIILYILVGLRGSGNLNSQRTKKISQKIFEARPYLENPNMMCRACSIPKMFRAVHCPMCKTCIPKFTRHSLVFGVCIGAANELLSLLFFLSVTVLSGYCLIKFTLLHALFGVITQVILYGVNVTIFWMSFTEFSTLLILNFNFGLSEYEVQSWMALQYLMKVPMREFFNTCNNGIMHSFTQSLFALLGASGFEAELYDGKRDSNERENQPLKEEITSTQSTSLGFPEVKEGVKYVVNWEKAVMVVIPQMPNNPLRKDVQKLMKMDQPKMIAKFKLLKKFQEEVKKQNPELNQFQIQQKAMMKMSEHMNKNPELMSAMKPPPEQQKAIQLQMLAHMKMQFQSDPEIFNQFQDIEAKLKGQQIGPDEAGTRMRGLQQKIMEKKMKQIMQAQKKQAQGQPQAQQAAQPEQSSLQSSIQAQLKQKLEQRQKELVKEEPKKSEKEEESDQLKQQQFVDDENL